MDSEDDLLNDYLFPKEDYLIPKIEPINEEIGEEEEEGFFVIQGLVDDISVKKELCENKEIEKNSSKNVRNIYVFSHNVSVSFNLN